MAVRTYAYCQYTPRPRRTECPTCGSRMAVQTSDPADRKLMCNNRVCNEPRGFVPEGRTEPHVTF